MPAKACEDGKEEDLGHHAKSEHRAIFRSGHREGRGPAAQVGKEELGARKACLLEERHHGVQA